MVCYRVRRSMGKSAAVVPTGQLEPKVKLPYKGITFYRRTGRWEANLWVKHEDPEKLTTRKRKAPERPDQPDSDKKKPATTKQHYLGASLTALEAARAYDKGIIFTRGSTDELLNFPRTDYAEDMKTMHHMDFYQYRAHLRVLSRIGKCQVVQKGIVIDQDDRWEVKFYVQRDKSYHFLGWFNNEETALRAYNEAALQHDGPTATITGFRGTPPGNPRNLNRRSRTRGKSGPGDYNAVDHSRKLPFFDFMRLGDPAASYSPIQQQYPNLERNYFSQNYEAVTVDYLQRNYEAVTVDYFRRNYEAVSMDYLSPVPYRAETGAELNLDHFVKLPPFDVSLSL